jgi:hypothetical protein
MKSRAADGVLRSSLRCGSACLWLSMALAATQAQALTQIDLVIGIGIDGVAPLAFSLTPADGPITAQVQGGEVEIDFYATVPVPPKAFWFLHFAPLEGEVLRPGNYPSAQGWPFQSPKRPGLNITGQGGCSASPGKFTVYEATFDSTGQVLSFAADAEQTCGTGAQARVRFNSDVPLLVTMPQSMPGWPQEVYEQAPVTLDGSQSYEPDGQIVSWRWSQVSGPKIKLDSPKAAVTTFNAPKVSRGGADLTFRLDVSDNVGQRATGMVSVHVFDQKDRRTLLTFVSPLGDYIGQAQTVSFSKADGDVVLGESYGLPAIDLDFDGGLDYWILDLAAARGAALLPGTYLNAERFPFQSAGKPGLDFYGSGRGCSVISGQFTVFEFDPTTRPIRFGARFVQSCEGFMPPLTGTVLFNAVMPGRPRAHGSGPTSAEAGAAVVLDGAASSSTGSKLVSHRWRQVDGPIVHMSDPTHPQLTFIMPDASVRFELGVMDEDGLMDAVEVGVEPER